MSLESRIWVVGLTGGIGCGKSAAAEAFAALGAQIVDADAISRVLTGPDGVALASIRDAFGASFVNAQTGMDRAAMRSLILKNPEAKRALEGILHPQIRAHMARSIADLPAGAWCIVELPLLFESLAYRTLMARTVAVDCPVDLQRRRVRERSGLSGLEIDGMIAAQVPRAIRLQLADEVLANSGSIEDLHAAARALVLRWPVPLPART